LLAIMPLAGWALGAATEVSELTTSALTAFLGGSVILNVLKEELPEERESRFSAFLLGAIGYSLLLLGVQTG
jgi:putative Mn2+ efflux pump MntP